MSEMKGSKGQWNAGWNGGLTGPRCPSTHGVTCEGRKSDSEQNWFPVAVGMECVGIGVGATNSEAKANARLIAAAPELYSALEAMLKDAEERLTEVPNPIYHSARAALAKARGES